MRTQITRSFMSATSICVALLMPVMPSFGFASGDVPAPVDTDDDGGPGRSHLNGSGVSGFDGNQGNDKLVGNANGYPDVTPPDDGGEDSEDGGEGGGEFPLPQ